MAEKFKYTDYQLESWDYVVLVVYFVSILFVGIWSTRRKKWCGKREDENQESGTKGFQDQVGNYFLASRNMHFIPVGASLFASNIGSEHFIGLAGSAASEGFAIACYELNAIFILILLGWLFVPVYHASGVFTMPEYMKKRFGHQRIRVLLSILSLIIYVLTKLSADLYAGALFIKYAIGIEGSGQEGLYLSILVLLAIAGFFCIVGGLQAVIWTDFVQTILMVIGVLILMGLSFQEVGGYEKLLDGYYESMPSENYSIINSVTNESCSKVRPDFAHLFHSIDDDFLPWTGVFTGMFIASVTYWCTDQVIVQRTLAAKNISHAKAGTVVAGFLKLFPFFTLVLPGMAARILFTNEVACSDPDKCFEICGSRSGCSNVSFVFLVLKLCPIVLRGLMFAVMLAALMSSLTSIFNSASTIFTMDVYTLVRKKATPIELVFIGRVFVLLMLAISIAWIPIIQQYKNAQLFVYVQVVSNFFQPPIAAIFLMAMLWKRTTEPGAFWGLLAGFLVGMIRFGLEFGYSAPSCADITDTRPQWVKTWVGNFHYLHFGTVLFLFTIVVTAMVSYLTEPIPDEKLKRLTFWTRFSPMSKNEIVQSSSMDPSSKENIKTTGFFSANNFSGAKKFLFTICGVSKNDLEQQANQSKESTNGANLDDNLQFIQENSKYKMILNIAAVCAMSAAAFVSAFYA